MALGWDFLAWDEAQPADALRSRWVGLSAQQQAWATLLAYTATTWDADAIKYAEALGGSDLRCVAKHWPPDLNNRKTRGLPPDPPPVLLKAIFCIPIVTPFYSLLWVSLESILYGNSLLGTTGCAFHAKKTGQPPGSLERYI